jgi:uncharacterized protein YaiI (UPF0178 family)
LAKEGSVKIWIDADGCPAAIKQLVFRAAERWQIAVCLVANRPLSVPPSPLITAVRVAREFDEADAYIVHEVAPGDLVITADLPLAAAVVNKGASALNPRGELYSQENIGVRLAVRNLMQDLRAHGLVQGGPGPLTAGERQKFATALNTLLTKQLQGQQ